jgi:hypothetical protein
MNPDPVKRPKLNLDPCPSGFRVFGHFDGLEAKSLLKRFEAAGIRFRVGRAEGLDLTVRPTRWYHYSFVRIFVHRNDQQKARAILHELWNV